MTPKDFIAQLSAPAQALAKTTKIFASFTIAQAALESGWNLSAPGNNIFSIKADKSWHGAVVLENTHEVINKVSTPVTAQFRAYASYLDSLQDHAQFLITNPRYKPAFETTNGIDFTKAVAAAGYATGLNYAQTIIEIINEHNLLALDT